VCEGCWREYGSPREINARVLEASRLAEKCDEYGPLHILIDDWNLENDHFPFLRAEAEKVGAKDDLALLDMLAPMSEDERATVLAIREGFIRV